MRLKVGETYHTVPLESSIKTTLTVAVAIDGSSLFTNNNMLKQFRPKFFLKGRPVWLDQQRPSLGFFVSPREVFLPVAKLYPAAGPCWLPPPLRTHNLHFLLIAPHMCTNLPTDYAAELRCPWSGPDVVVLSPLGLTAGETPKSMTYYHMQVTDQLASSAHN